MALAPAASLDSPSAPSLNEAPEEMGEGPTEPRRQIHLLIVQEASLKGLTLT